MRIFALTERRALSVTGFFFGMGTLWHYFDFSRPFVIALTPWLLLVLGIATLVVALRNQGPGLLAWLVPTYLATFGLEVLGVATGLVFGPYYYSPVLGRHLFGVPPLIGFNWVLVVLGAGLFSRRTLRLTHPVPGALAAALLCVVFDVIMEPLAIRLGYWTWIGGSIPLQNYVAWFLIAFGAALPTWLLPAAGSSRWVQGYIAIQALFFLFTRIALAL